MPLEFQSVEIVLGGLDQKSGPLTRGSGSLERAVNVEFDKLGQLNKRRGYQFVDTLTDVVGAPASPDGVMAHLATLRGELVIFTRCYVAALASRESLLRGEDAVVYRGPNGMGACASRLLTMSGISDNYPEGGG